MIPSIISIMCQRTKNKYVLGSSPGVHSYNISNRFDTKIYYCSLSVEVMPITTVGLLSVLRRAQCSMPAHAQWGEDRHKPKCYYRAVVCENPLSHFRISILLHLNTSGHQSTWRFRPLTPTMHPHSPT